MAKNLVIVESPAKARTINKYLGDDYVVKSSVGHIRDLPKKASVASKNAGKKTQKKSKRSPEQRLVDRLAVNPYKGWEARYEIVPGKEKVLKELKDWARKSQVIYLATDLDREGEAIAWHLQESLKDSLKGEGEGKLYKRVIFSEITRKALEKAFREPTTVDMHRVHAQQTRRFLDRVVGFMVSPLLWSKVARGLSAGRVQSVAVRLIVDREKEIKSFVPEEYWQMDVAFASRGDIRAKVAKHKGGAYRPQSAEQSAAHERALQGAQAIVVQREDKAKSVKPPAPFITSTLQQAASQRLGFAVKRTMMAAQRLYEGGYISYMRTDSTHLSEEALVHSRLQVQELFGSRYLPAQPQRYQSRKNAQEAHEAIRPSDFARTPDDLRGSLEKDQHSLYELIWKRSVASQMNPATYDSTSVVLSSGEYQLRLAGRTLRFDGFQRLLPPSTSETHRSKEEITSASLASFSKGDKFDITQCFPHQHFTKPLPRFTEGRLVAELEKQGIGRPSTYAAIISTIQERGYVKAEQRRFYALKMGEVVTAKLQGSFEDLMDYSFTAKMEQKLDDIASGCLGWQETLDQFYAEFKNRVDFAQDHMQPLASIPTDMPCPECDVNMFLVTTARGVFLSCSQREVGEKKARTKKSQKEEAAKDAASQGCSKNMSLYPADDFEEVAAADLPKQAEKLSVEEQQIWELRSRPRCPLCSSVMDSYVVDEGHKLHVCSQSPQCPGTTLQKGTFKLKGYDGPVLECDRCGADMQLKTGRFGKYFACTVCPNTRKLLKNGEVAPPKADPVPMPELLCEKSSGHFILRDGAAGIFLASSLFPRSKETKKPKVADLKRHREELDPKFHHLADAPAKDPDGVDFVIRFSRKAKEHYLTSEDSSTLTAKKGAKKPPPWIATYREGEWEVQRKSSSTKRSAAKKQLKAAPVGKL